MDKLADPRDIAGFNAPEVSSRTSRSCLLRIIGSVRSRASWAKVVRQSAIGLQSLGIDVGIEEDVDGYLDPTLCLDARVVNALATSWRGASVDLAIVRPERFAEVFGAHRRIGMMVFEADRWPLPWIDAARRYADLILTPSKFCRDGLIQSGFPAGRVVVLPHGVDCTTFRPKDRVSSRVQPLRVLFVGTPARRKGLDLLLAAMAVAFPSGSGASLTVKTERWPTREDAVGDVTTRIQALRESGLSVSVIESSMSETELATLYRSHDILCLPHRGEGFAMTCLEAMACGTPVVATAWSGPMDFLDDAVGWPLRSFHYRDTTGLLPDSFPSSTEARMVEPNFEELVSVLRWLARNVGTGELCKRGSAAVSRAASFDWSQIAQRLKDIAITCSPSLNRLSEESLGAGAAR